MHKFVILLSNDRCSLIGRGVALSDFLRKWYARRDVRVLTVDTLRELPAVERIRCETLFIGVPTDVTAAELDRIVCSRAALFDFGEHDRVQWDQSDKAMLLTRSDLYLKTHIESPWPDDPVRRGLLPVYRGDPRAWFAIVRHGGAYGALKHNKRPLDVSFTGNATARSFELFERIHWVRQLRTTELSFWGGIAFRSEKKEQQVRGHFGDIDDVVLRKRVNIFTYWRKLLESKVGLAPAGNARWTHRHYEVVYAANVIVSTDYRNVRMLAPVPRETMIHVPDNENVVPYVREALTRLDRRVDEARAAIDMLEQYFKCGMWHRSRPRALDEFLAQLD